MNERLAQRPAGRCHNNSCADGSEFRHHCCPVGALPTNEGIVVATLSIRNSIVLQVKIVLYKPFRLAIDKVSFALTHTATRQTELLYITLRVENHAEVLAEFLC